MSSTNGFTRFEFYLDKLDALFQQASNEKNPALWLYTNSARTPLFMLEGLAKLYANIHNKKKFEKLKEQLKLLEDTLGAIDYYDSLAKEFAGDAAIPAILTDYLQGQAREKIQRLNDLLVSEKWIAAKSNRIKKVRKKLAAADWKEPKEELKEIFNFYKRSIKEIKEFMYATGDGFTEIESQVHAIRRKLRWLSIYPQALQGIIQFNDSNIINEKVKKYLIPEIVDSPFNKMPETGSNTYFLLLEKHYFLALSWMIAELGRLKDSGLKILAITEAFQQTQGINQDDALDRAYEVLGINKNALQNILADATAVCKIYFSEGNLDKLIYGISSAKKEKN